MNRIALANILGTRFPIRRIGLVFQCLDCREILSPFPGARLDGAYFFDDYQPCACLRPLSTQSILTNDPTGGW